MATITRRANTRVIKKPEARPPLWRRIFSRKLAFALAILALIGCSIFAFFYVRYSALIDARLRGDVIVRTTGIYAAPRTIRQGSGATLGSIKIANRGGQNHAIDRESIAQTYHQHFAAYPW